MKQDETSRKCESTPEASKKRSRTSDNAETAVEGTPSLLSAPQIAVFLNNRPDLNKPVTNDELRKHIKSTLNIADHIPKAALKSTLRQIVAARSKKRKTQSSKEVKATTVQAPLPENYLKGDWRCTICGNHNYAKRKDCVKCSAPQPGSTAAKRAEAIKANPGKKKEKVKGEDDWICSKCENRNFATRKKCNKCHLPKAECEPKLAKPKTADEDTQQQNKKASVWEAETLLTKEQVEEFVQQRDYSSGPVTQDELRNHMLWDLHMEQTVLYNKVLFANTLRA
eukprot:CAMPEP_0118945772 /NCGR_PEP_ID=MMETSP1169-20130426/42937_1 /TAXON_ID=36882 /ORGANISM="Pyramimonas obovata, Strain CCMP722" /LENGTH=281 /DNA_ID=CAMNT_0006891561 /DNA_START=213 /DNA_END=1055 /DNA_ORIENTATION=+